MFRQFEPGTVVLGATPVLTNNIAGVPVRAYDKKGRPIWNMPKPSGHVIHFKSAFARQQYDAEVAALTASTSPKDPEFRKKMIEVERKAKVSVPLYRGFSCTTARCIRATAIYRQKIHNRRNLGQAAPIRSFMEGIKAISGKLVNKEKA